MNKTYCFLMLALMSAAIIGCGGPDRVFDDPVSEDRGDINIRIRAGSRAPSFQENANGRIPISEVLFSLKDDPILEVVPVQPDPRERRYDPEYDVFYNGRRLLNIVGDFQRGRFSDFSDEEITSQLSQSPMDISIYQPGFFDFQATIYMNHPGLEVIIHGMPDDNRLNVLVRQENEEAILSLYIPRLRIVSRMRDWERLSAENPQPRLEFGVHFSQLIGQSEPDGTSLVDVLIDTTRLPHRGSVPGWTWPMNETAGHIEGHYNGRMMYGFRGNTVQYKDSFEADPRLNDDGQPVDRPFISFNVQTQGTELRAQANVLDTGWRLQVIGEEGFLRTILTTGRYQRHQGEFFASELDIINKITEPRVQPRNSGGSGDDGLDSTTLPENSSISDNN